MAIDVTTGDAITVGDAELAEFAELALSRGAGFDIGFLSKLREDWVLCSYIRQDGELCGFVFYTLERIGGTPCILIGLSVSKEDSFEKDYLFELLAEQYRKALLAFPDEDVLVGVRMVSLDGYDLYAGLEDIVPRPGHKPTGEERAWARRLAKRYGAESQLDDKTFIINGDASTVGYLVYGDLTRRDSSGYGQFFENVNASNCDSLVVFGWAMAEKLADGLLPPQG